MDPSSYPPVLHFLLLPAKIILLVFAGIPITVCFWKAVDAVGDGFRPSVATIFWWSSREEPPSKQFDVRSLLIWGIALAVGLFSFVVLIVDIGISLAVRP